MTLELNKTQKMIFTLVEQEGPHDVMSFLEMIEALKEVEGDGLWSHAIRKVFSDPSVADVDALISQLASQATDDPISMSGDIGPDLTAAVLRTLIKD